MLLSQRNRRFILIFAEEKRFFSSAREYKELIKRKSQLCPLSLFVNACASTTAVERSKGYKEPRTKNENVNATGEDLSANTNVSSPVSRNSNAVSRYRGKPSPSRFRQIGSKKIS